MANRPRPTLPPLQPGNGRRQPTAGSRAEARTPNRHSPSFDATMGKGRGLRTSPTAPRMPGSPKPVSPRRWIAGVAAAAVVVLAGFGVYSLITSRAVPAAFQQFTPLMEALPANSDVLLVAQGATLLSTWETVAETAPEVANALDAVSSTALRAVRELTFLRTLDSWLGGYAAVALSVPAGQAPSFTLVAELNQANGSYAFLVEQFGALDAAPVQDGGYTRHALTFLGAAAPAYAFLAPNQLVLTDRATLSGGATPFSEADVRDALAAMPAPAYDAVLVLRTGEVLRAALGAISTALSVPLNAQGSVVIALAEPAPNTLIIDIARQRQGRAMFVESTRYPVSLPASSAAALYFSSPAAWYEGLLAAPWVNALVPQARTVAARVNEVVSTSGFNFERDVLAWMRGDGAAFIDAPQADEPAHAFDWGVILASSSQLNTQDAYRRLADFSTWADALLQWFPVLPLNVTTGAIETQPALTVQFTGSGQAESIAAASLNGGAQFVFGSRYGVRHVIQAQAAETVQREANDPLRAYARSESSLRLYARADAFTMLANWLSGNSTPAAGAALGAGAANPLDALYLDVSFDEAGLSSARVVLISPVAR